MLEALPYQMYTHAYISYTRDNFLTFIVWWGSVWQSNAGS